MTFLSQVGPIGSAGFNRHSRQQWSFIGRASCSGACRQGVDGVRATYRPADALGRFGRGYQALSYGKCFDPAVGSFSAILSRHLSAAVGHWGPVRAASSGRRVRG